MILRPAAKSIGSLRTAAGILRKTEKAVHTERSERHAWASGRDFATASLAAIRRLLVSDSAGAMGGELTERYNGLSGKRPTA